MQAMDLAPDGWRRVAFSDDAGCKGAVKGMAKLHAIANGEARLSRTKAEQWTREPPRDCRRSFGLSYAAMGVSSSMA